MITRMQVQSHLSDWHAAQFPITQALCAADTDCAAYGMASDQAIEQIEQAIATCRAALDALECTINECGTHSEESPVCNDSSCPCHAQGIV